MRRPSLPCKDLEVMKDWEINSKIKGDPHQLAKTIQTRLSMAASDGSFQGMTGSAAWTIAGISKQTKFWAKEAGHLGHQQTKVYGSELFGLCRIPVP